VTRPLPDLSALTDAIATAQETAVRIATQEVTGTSADGLVTARGTGAGAVTALELHPLAARRLDSVALGERVAEAVNSALDRAEDLRPEMVQMSDLEGKLEVFHSRMDGLLHRLDRLVKDFDDGS
jgi:DNA-binding protein YbaB